MKERKKLYFIESVLPHADHDRTPLEIAYVFVASTIISMMFLFMFETETVLFQISYLTALELYFLISLFLLIAVNISAYNYIQTDEKVIYEISAYDYQQHPKHTLGCIKAWLLSCLLTTLLWPILIPLSIVKYIRYYIFEPFDNKKQHPLYMTIIRKLLRKELVERKLAGKENLEK